MKRNYKLGQRLMAYVLLFPFFLQSCYNLSNPLIIVEEDPEIAKHVLIEEKEDKKFIAQGGHIVAIQEQYGQLQAIVEENLPEGFSRQLVLPVYGEPGLSNIQELSQHNPSFHKHHVHVCFPEKISQGKGYVYIGKRGLMGGMEDEKVGNDQQGEKKSEKGQTEEKKKKKKTKKKVNKKEEKGGLNLDIMKDRVLSFQDSWFKDASGAYNSQAYKELEQLGNEGNSVLKRISLLYPSDVDTPEKKFGRYLALISFYENGTAEPYLSKEENQAKITRLQREKRSILQTHDQGCKKIELFLNNGVDCLNASNYKKAKSFFLLAQSFPRALYSLGWLYEEGHTEKDNPDYQTAAEYYKKAATTDSFCDLGRLYMNGLVGKIGGKSDYQTAVEYLELSDTPESLFNLGIIFREGYVGKVNNQPNYQKAREYFERSNTGSAHFNLGQLYKQGHIGKNTHQPNYEQAKKHFEVSADKGYADAWAKLAYLYLKGYIGKVNDQPNYKLAVKYLKKATNSKNVSDYFKAQSFYNLGVVYGQGYWGCKQGQPDYQAAIGYFEQSNLPESFYSIGSLYEEGHIEAKPNYQKALEYHLKSELPKAKIAILGLYQLDLVKAESTQKKQQIIDTIIDEINTLLPSLSGSECYYIKGVTEYYTGNWEEALISLQQALAFGSEEEGLIELIEEISNYLVKKEKEEEKEPDPPASLEIVQEVPGIVSKEEELPELPQSIRVEEKKIPEISLLDKVDKKTSIPSFTKSPISVEAKIKKLTKGQKKLISSQRIRSRFLNALDSYPRATQNITSSIEFEFLDEKQKENFKKFKEGNTKIKELLNDIKLHRWQANGAGKPEVLRYEYKGYKGCISRRINHEVRMVYKPIGQGKILILEWDGHYK